MWSSCEFLDQNEGLVLLTQVILSQPCFFSYNVWYWGGSKWPLATSKHGTMLHSTQKLSLSLCNWEIACWIRAFGIPISTQFFPLYFLDFRHFSTIMYNSRLVLMFGMENHLFQWASAFVKQQPTSTNDIPSPGNWNLFGCWNPCNLNSSTCSYCLAVSYRPLVTPLADSFKDSYFEVPLLRDHPRIGNLVRTHSIGQCCSFFFAPTTTLCFCCYARLDGSQEDAFFDSDPLKTAEDVIQRYFTGHILCGMIVTQYEVAFEIERGF